MYPRPGSNRHAFKGQGILSPSCLPIPPLRHLHKKSRLYSGPCGAENETRTRDPDLGKVVLYQLSYFRNSGAENETRTRDPDLGKVVLYQLSYFRLRFARQKYNFFQYRKQLMEKFFFPIGLTSDYKTVIDSITFLFHSASSKPQRESKYRCWCSECLP